MCVSSTEEKSIPWLKSIIVPNVLMTYKASLPKIRFHDLRLTAASLILQESILPKIVQERQGHSRISLTLDSYSHVIPAMQKEAAI